MFVFVFVFVLLALQIMAPAFCSGLSPLLLLRGKRVLVTGGGRGIGRAIALICHREGARVVITSRTRSELEETVRLSNESGNDNDERKRLRVKQSAAAAALLSRRRGKPNANATARATSVGARRAGSASNARATGGSSISRLVDAVKTGSSSVATVDSNENENDENNNMACYVCDVTDESRVESVVQEILEKEGEIDVLINNAGGAQSPKGPVGSLNGSDLEHILKLNVLGPHLVTSAVVKHSASWKNEVESNAEETEHGKEDSPSSQTNTQHTQKVVLNVSSRAGKVGLQNYSLYVASKFALEGLTSSWSKELAPSNIRVHSLSPGMVDTKSFPKPKGKKGVREASSIGDCLLFALTGRIPVVKSKSNSNSNSNAVGGDGDGSDNTQSNNDDVQPRDMMDFTGHYIHVDEYDQVVREEGVGGAHLAWKPIDEVPFRVL